MSTEPLVTVPRTSDNCATAGCPRKATYRMVYQVRSSRDPELSQQVITDDVCRPCFEGYCRRPSLLIDLSQSRALGVKTKQ